MVNIKKCIWKN